MGISKTALTVAIMMLASAFVAGTGLLAKALGTSAMGAPLNPFQITAGRFVFAFAALLVFTALVRPQFSRPAVLMHFGRASAGYFGVTFMFASAALMPLADATAISMINPIIAMVLAVPLLKEHVGPKRWFAAALSITGAVLLIRPGTSSFQPAALIALLSAFVLAIEIILVKLLSAREKTVQILLFSNGFGCLFSAVALMFVWVQPSPMQWAGLAGIGLLMVSAQTLFLFALRRGDASFVAPLFYATLVFTAIYDLIIFDVSPSRLTYIGSAIIILGALIIAWSERQRAR